MAFSSQQISYLKNADQRFKAHIALFPPYTPTITAPSPGNGTALTFKPIPMVSPRYSVVDNGGAITLYATDSYNRGGTYVGNGNIAWDNTGGDGTLVDNGDGTATYTAPGVGSGTNLITMTATNTTGSKDALVYVAYPKTSYDNLVAEIASITGSAAQKGWSITLRVRGDTSEFAIGKIALLHVEDTWGTTSSTFGGYKYSEGVFCGYITTAEYYEDWSGECWLGLEIKSSWSKLQKIQISETMWGKTSRVGRFYIHDFRPVDALWYLLNETTDFTSRHNCTLFYDTNVIDDFIVGRGTESNVNLADIITDVMDRGLAIAYTDRYSSLLCIPDPDVRSDEWWGTPDPLYGGGEPLTEKLCKGYSVTYYDVPAVRRMALIAYDSYRLGMWAVSQASAGTQGSEEKIQGLLCDDTLKLVQWASEKRAQANKLWDINVNLPLNHTLDLYNPLVCVFTAPRQAGGKTASGLCWINSISYRPTMDGGWEGNWNIVKNSQGDTGANGEVSGWGGSGQWGENGTGGGIAPSGWTDPTSDPQTWIHMFDFVNSGSGKFIGLSSTAQPGWGNMLWSPIGPMTHDASGWKSNSTFYTYSGAGGYIRTLFPSRTLTGIQVWASADSNYVYEEATIAATHTASTWETIAGTTTQPSGAFSLAWTGSRTGSGVAFGFMYATTTVTACFKSAQLAGLGTDPFG